MGNSVPTTATTLMFQVYRHIFPQVKQELSYWSKRAQQIPNAELRQQALTSIQTKRFHCQGGSVYALLAGRNWRLAIRFIVAYQTISDYLDNLCDRSTSMDPADFSRLHEAMQDALQPDQPVKNYYDLRNEQADGDYLIELVKTCQQTLGHMQGYPVIKPELLALQKLYGELQVHKHVRIDERVPRLVNWFVRSDDNRVPLYWFEFSAATGSTLGIFCLVSYTLGGQMTELLARQIVQSYFPYMQALHILMDYYIDQNEDEQEGDLNFCHYYPSPQKMKERLIYFITETRISVQVLPDRRFHEMIQHGLVGLYLADTKVAKLIGGKTMTTSLLKASGMRARFFYWNARLYHDLVG